MADNEVSIESVEVPLFSEMASASAKLMKDAYLLPPQKKPDIGKNDPRSESGNRPQEDKDTGPDARIYLTSLSVRTPDEVISGIFGKSPDRGTIRHNCDYYTIVLASSLRVTDPATTLFINAIVTVDFPQGVEILEYAPKGNGIITGIIEKGGDGISISRILDFNLTSSKEISDRSINPENRFEVPVGPMRTMTVTCSRTTGYTFAIPASELFEYNGMPENNHRMFWEVYPPMLPQSIGIPGNGHMALLALIIQTPRNTAPAMNVSIDARVKGDLWGVVHLKGSVGLSKP
jgi:hypothetical protein